MADGKARTISANLRAFGTFAWRSQSISSLLSTEHKSDNSESETFFSLSSPSEISDRFLFLSVRLDKNVCSYGEAITIRKPHNFSPSSCLGQKITWKCIITWSGSSYLCYLLNKLATLMVLSALGKVLLVLKRYLSSCLKRQLTHFAICAPWTGGKR